MLDIGKYEFSVLGIIYLIPKFFIRYNMPNTKTFFLFNQAFTFKLELIGINFLQENESIPISIILSNSHDNYRLNWNDLDAN